MKKNWENLVNAIQKLIDDDSVVINGLRSCGEVTKIKKNFKRNVEAIGKAIDEMDTLLPDPDNKPIELPFESNEFSEAWDDYKEYLRCVFDIVLVPVEEKKRLNKLYKLSSKNEKVAIDIIDFLISSRYKTIFKPTDFQLSGNEPDAQQEVGFSIKKSTL